MSLEVDRRLSPETLKFDVNKTYTRDDYLFRLSGLLAIYAADPELSRILKHLINRADDLPPETMIGWEIGEDKVIRPVPFLKFG